MSRKVKVNVREQNKNATRAKVLISANFLFSKYGYEGTTMRMIAQHMGMSTGALFNNFCGKAEVFRELYGHDPMDAVDAVNLLKAAKLVTEQLRATRTPEDGALYALVLRHAA